jgi:hypothetical protein
MTIAVCYLSPEGVVFGADSTSSTLLPSAPGTFAFHYFNHNQKLFQIGENGSLGVVTWGLGGLGAISYRTLLAKLADKLKAPANVLAVATSWANLFWTAYSTELKSQLSEFQTLKAKNPFDANASNPDPKMRTKDEEEKFASLSRDLVVGFCLGGHVTPHRTPEAFIVIFEPNLGNPPTPTQVQMNGIRWFGVPNLILRLINGYDTNIVQGILKSPKWTGDEQELRGILDQYQLSHAVLPIRDAIDYVYTSIYSTIKALKFSSFSQVCGPGMRRPY